MPRKGHVPKRKVLPDPIYNSPIVTRLINSIMLDGKKGVAQQILYNAFDRIEKATSRPALDVFNEALVNITPQLEVRARRIGGSNYQVPVEVRTERKMTLCLRWLTQYSRLRKEKTMEERLANEIMDAAKGLGASVKKRDDVHRMAESNKAFAHYSW
jgi:small subunit ribosomal protein S7